MVNFVIIGSRQTLRKDEVVAARHEQNVNAVFPQDSGDALREASRLTILATASGDVSVRPIALDAVRRVMASARTWPPECELENLVPSLTACTPKSCTLVILH